MKKEHLYKCSKQSCSHVLLESERVLIQRSEISKTATCPKCGNESFFTLNEQGQVVSGWAADSEIDPNEVEPSPRLGAKMKARVLEAKNRALVKAGRANPLVLAKKSNLEWHDGPARKGTGTHGPSSWYDGDSLAVILHKKEYEVHLIRISCDEHYFSIEDLLTGQDWGWDESDILSWAKINGEPAFIRENL